MGRNLRFRHPSTWGFPARRALDFGCGSTPRNPFLAHEFYFADTLNIEELRLRSRTSGISDQYVLDNYSQITRFASLPFNDKFFDVVTAFDVLEHLSRENTNGPNEFISVLNEIHRVLVPGGIFLALTPAFPSPAAFQDPTHINFITEFTSHYFIGADAPAKVMGYGLEQGFELVAQFWQMPLSQITAEVTEGFTLRQIFSAVTSISKLRSFISGVRKPTHLVWILQKPH